MKRFLAALLIASLCLSMAGCALLDGFQYIKAMNLYEEGSFEEALPIFTELSDYADSQAMAALCKQRVDYAEAERLFAAADYRPALELYTSLMLYEDSPMKAVRCQYAIGMACMESGNYEEAVTWFDALGGYEDAPDKLLEAKWMWLYTYAEANGGTVEYPADEDGSQVLSLSCGEENTLILSYKAEGHLLGVPYMDEIKITLERGSQMADYTVYCSSTVASKIEEEVTGQLRPGGFVPGTAVEMATFRQTISVESLAGEEPAEPTVTEDPAQALLVTGFITSAQTAVAEALPALLEATGVTITARELGFTSVE